MDVLGPWLEDGLPADVTGHVVVMDRYWLPDEAQSLFARAQAVVSIENHSPLLAAAAGTPFVMVHQPEDSFKSDMFTDIGLRDWYVPDINRASGDDIARMLMGIVSDMPAARAKLARAMAFVNERQRFGMMEVRWTLGLSTDASRIPGPGLQVERKTPFAAGALHLSHASGSSGATIVEGPNRVPEIRGSRS
jgi:hypothetical protein